MYAPTSFCFGEIPKLLLLKAHFIYRAPKLCKPLYNSIFRLGSHKSPDFFGGVLRGNFMWNPHGNSFSSLLSGELSNSVGDSNMSYYHNNNNNDNKTNNNNNKKHSLLLFALSLLMFIVVNILIVILVLVISVAIYRHYAYPCYHYYCYCNTIISILLSYSILLLLIVVIHHY